MVGVTLSADDVGLRRPKFDAGLTSRWSGNPNRR